MRDETNLVEFERVEEIVELAVLGGLLETNEVLLQTVKRELLLIVDVNFEGLMFRKRLRVRSRQITCSKRSGGTHRLHELLAGCADLLGERGREHHDLLVVRSRLEDLLNIAAHV